MMGDDASVIRSQLLVPFAGYRNYKGAEVYDLGGDAYLRSSSPSSAGNPNSRNLTLFMRGGGDMFNDSRANANSLRCVYDSYETYTPA